MNDTQEPGSQDDDPQDALPYEALDKIQFGKTLAGFCSLILFREDHFLTMQAYNIQIVDEWTTRLEYQVLKELFDTEHTPPEAAFLNAQSQMWIMAVYELLRTWRQRVTYVADHAGKGTLQSEIDALKKDEGYFHAGKQARIAVLEDALKHSDIVGAIARDKKRLHIAFRRIEAIRMTLAKHELRGKANSVPLNPGYGRINKWCGSLDYELENGKFSLGLINRRQVADSLRALADASDPPTDEKLAAFDAYMRGSVPG